MCRVLNLLLGHMGRMCLYLELGQVVMSPPPPADKGRSREEDPGG